MTVPLRRISRLTSALPPVCAVALSIAAAVAPAAQARAAVPGPGPLAINGGFETPSIPANAFIRYGVGSSIGPWRVTQGNVDLTGANFWQAADGRQSLDLEGSDSGTIEQPVSTRIGGCYTVAFALAGNPDGGPTVKRGYARVSQRTLGHPTVQKNFIFNTTGKTRANMGYVSQRFRFRAFAPSATLTFASTTGGGYGPVVDAVTVTLSNPIECRLVRP
ncbi:choice-of-anchor C family protein [Actinomadura sp. DC4]|uniref:choice-of-anchor C family protein n=1 Tax=Actinomadura sp. DC4 TaxID=3055069 RepID=UPI0025B1BD2B|nr:choice-of-anchor C family protein [Actinomadura sp. DC4]MDN3353366.1 choice-of-anchor C family protein [Actinomadura sp. DC4]